MESKELNEAIREVYESLVIKKEKLFLGYHYEGKDRTVSTDNPEPVYIEYNAVENLFDIFRRGLDYTILLGTGSWSYNLIDSLIYVYKDLGIIMERIQGYKGYSPLPYPYDDSEVGQLRPVDNTSGGRTHHPKPNPYSNTSGPLLDPISLWKDFSLRLMNEKSGGNSSNIIEEFTSKNIINNNNFQKFK